MTDALTHLDSAQLQGLLNQSLQKKSCVGRPYACGVFGSGVGVFLALGSGLAHSIVNVFERLSRPLIQGKTHQIYTGGVTAKLEDILHFWFTETHESNFFSHLKWSRSDFEYLLKNATSEKKTCLLNALSVAPGADFTLVPMSEPKSQGGCGYYAFISQGFWTPKGLEVSGGAYSVLPEGIKMRFKNQKSNETTETEESACIN